MTETEADPILRAVHESVGLDHHWVGVEHLLLALARAEEGRVSLAQQVLADSGITPESVRSTLASVPMPPDPSHDARGATPRLMLVTGRAEGLATAAGSRSPTDEHFLIALLWEPQGLHALVFERCGVNPHDVQLKLRDRGVDVPDVDPPPFAFAGPMFGLDEATT